jgi:hypothetical protein
MHMRHSRCVHLGLASPLAVPPAAINRLYPLAVPPPWRHGAHSTAAESLGHGALTPLARRVRMQGFSAGPPGQDSCLADPLVRPLAAMDHAQLAAWLEVFGLPPGPARDLAVDMLDAAGPRVTRGGGG